MCAIRVFRKSASPEFYLCGRRCGWIFANTDPASELARRERWSTHVGDPRLAAAGCGARFRRSIPRLPVKSRPLRQRLDRSTSSRDLCGVARRLRATGVLLAQSVCSGVE